MQYIYAFLVGGAICLIGQLLIDKTKLTPAKILTGFVIAGVALSALGLYQPLADFAGEGAAVPLSGFGNLMAEGMKDALREDGALGILTGALKS
ncbi:MAG: SpoVA/SpoVAEb family sporulation membrane protein, partial [Ruminococcus sp.]|nr:SpoVA/SpoVAEb family sporulation membrane protein [Ruminococcus sp.]